MPRFHLAFYLPQESSRPGIFKNQRLAPKPEINSPGNRVNVARGKNEENLSRPPKQLRCIYFEIQIERGTTNLKAIPCCYRFRRIWLVIDFRGSSESSKSLRKQMELAAVTTDRTPFFILFPVGQTKFADLRPGHLSGAMNNVKVTPSRRELGPL